MSFSLLLAATPGWAQAPPPGSVPVDASARTNLQGFGIVLVLGDVQDGASDSVPPGARAALADLKDFLPYRSYRVLDTAWVLASSATRQSIGSRLQGADEQVFDVVLEYAPIGQSLQQVHFFMREPGAARQVEAAARNSDRQALLKRQLMDSVEQLKQAELKLSSSHPDVMRLRRRVAEIETELARVNAQDGRYVAVGDTTLIDTSFNMSLGETVVVGTSRMRGGNKALIVLLTAATRAKPRE
jgi:hypothetical protein